MKTEKIKTLSAHQSLYIETPAGVVEIKMADDDGKPGRRQSRKLVFKLPLQVSVYHKREHINQTGRFVRIEDDGRVTPKFKLLAPVMDDSGDLEGLAQPKVMTLRTGT